MRETNSTTKMAQYVVRSNVHMMNLDNALSRLLGREQFIDVTLACDGHKFRCHRLILAASSPLFEELLMDNPTTHPIVILPLGIKSYTLKSLIDFMYKGQTYVNQNGLKDLVESAELLQVTGLYDSQTQIREYYEDVDNGVEQDERQEQEIDYEKYDKTTIDGIQIHNEKTTELGEVNDELTSINTADSDSKEKVIDFIEIEDSVDAPVSNEAINNDNVDELSRPKALFSSAINNDYCPLEIEPKDIQAQQTQKLIATNIPTIRVKPTIKLINLFQLTAKTPINGQFQSSNKHVQPTSIPWTYIHIPAADSQTSNTEALAGSIHTSQMDNRIPTFRSETNNSSLPFLKFNSRSMAISVKNVENTNSLESPQVLNMALQDEQDTETKCIEYDHASEVHLKSEYGTTNDTNEIELGDTILSEADFPKFYAMIKKEREEKAARLAKEKELVAGNEAENIICQPNVSYIYESNVDGGGLECNDSEIGLCIDYDRLVAETYGNDECGQKLKNKYKKQQKKKQSKLKKSDESKPTYLTPNLLSVPKNKAKRPPTLVPLSVVHGELGPKHFFCPQNSELDANEKVILNEHRPDIAANYPTNGGEPYSPQTVILRNPRCNQPRHYSTESLYSALMAVKHGESIYRASRLHQVPRKTLRNWMKRWDIKSQFPMPKQLKDAAKKKKENQNT